MPKATAKSILKVLLTHIRPHAPLFGLIVFCVIAGTSLDMVGPWLYKIFFDLLFGADGNPQSLLPALIRVLVIILVVHTAGWFLWRVGGFVNLWMDPRVSAELERTSFRYLLAHSYHFFANAFAGSLVRKVRRLSRSSEDILNDFFWDILPLFTVTILALVGLFSRNKMIGLAVLVWVIITAIFSIVVAIWKLKYDKLKSAQDSIVTGVLSDAVTNSTNINLFAAHKHESALFAEATENYRRLHTWTWFVGDATLSIQTFLMIGLEFAVLYLGATLWARGILTVGDFALFQGYLLMLFHKFWDLDRVVRRAYEALADASEMVEILETPHAIVDTMSARPLRVTEGKIQFEGIEFCYHKTRRILQDFTLEIAPKEKVALVGSSGAGKSTIVKLLLRLHDLDRGKILIDGQNVVRVTQDSLHRAIALVPQDPVLFHRTLEENIRYGRRNASAKDVLAASKKARCHDFIKELPEGYNTFVGERGIKLSGGERQRVAIARAILADTPILVLDEATSSLDSHSEAMIQAALKELMKNKTVVVIAHRLSTIMEMDRIVVVEGGPVKDQGTHAELL